MDIRILQLSKGAEKAEGLTVIIDVFRAFTTACYIMQDKPDHLYPVLELEEAYALHKKYPDSILVGEREEKKPTGFHFGNSPSQVKDYNFHNKTVIHTTTAGTNGINKARHAEEIITGSFVNARAIASYIQQQNPAVLSLVCMGYRAEQPTDEDTFCAEYIQSLLSGMQYPLEEKKEQLKKGAGSRFFDPANQTFSPEEDFHLCTRENQFSFILRARKDSVIELERINVRMTV